MSAPAPWSVKGIDPKAREMAKDLARREGMTLGEWLNTRIMTEGDAPEDEEYNPFANGRRASDRVGGEASAARLATERLNSVVSELASRLEEAERRSASAIQGVDQAVSGVMRRLDNEREENDRQTRRLDDVAHELREGHSRLQKLEMDLRDPLRTDAVTADLKERLDRAQEATGLALKGLERSFAALESRLGEGSRVDEARLTQLAEGLSRQIEANRLDMMRRIDAVADNSRLARVEQSIGQLTAQTRDAEMRSARAVEAMGQEVMRIARNMNVRVQTLEQADQGLGDEAINSRIEQRLDQRLLELGRTLDEKLDREIARQSASLDTRLTRQEDDHALALERLGGEITRISDRLSERITQTERRSAQAIEDIGRRLSESSEKFERRHEDASGELSERLRQSEERTRRLIEEAREARAQREAASLNAAPRLTASVPPADDLAFEPMPEAARPEAPLTSLFSGTREEWLSSAFSAGVSAPLPEAQASPGWDDAVAAEMAVEPFPTSDSLRPFGSLDAALDETLEEDMGLDLDGPMPSQSSPDNALGDFAAIFAAAEQVTRSEPHEALSVDADEGEDEFVTETLVEGEPEIAIAEVDDLQGMTFEAEAEEQPADRLDAVWDSALTTRDVLESARAAMADEEPVASRSSFGLKKQRKGGTSQLQQKLDRKASRESSTFSNALKASALAMLVVGGGGYASLKVAKDQNLNFNFGTDLEAPTAPIAALALETTPTEAVPSAAIAATEGAAIFARALPLLDSGDPAGLEALRRSAEIGYIPAQMRLAALYSEGGLGLEIDPVQARDWTRRAAEGGEPRAMQHFATQLYDGVGGAADEAGALEWMRKAAEAGRVDAQYNLAHLYESGIKGMSPDKVEAFTWYMIAARRGDQQALEAVQRLTASLSNDERRRAREGADAFNIQPAA